VSARGRLGGGAQRGFSLLELVTALTIVLVAAGALLGRLRLYQEAAEKADMEYTVNTLRLALQLRIAHDLGRQRPVDYAAVARENPVSWLEAPMKGYRGEPGPAEAALLPRGSWYFDRARGELAYVPLRDSHLAADGPGSKRVRFKARLVRAVSGTGVFDAAAVGVTLGPMQPYRWLD
jgi:prepilin-type N-terminal cleavage/methylation domain-containing protein